MSTLAELKATIAGDLHRDDLGTLIDEETDRAIKYYGNERFWFLEGTTSITASASLSWYAVPSDFQRFDSMTITISGNKSPMDLVDYDWIDRKDTGTVFGIPSRVAYYKDQFRVFPSPNSSYVMNLSYQKSIAAPEEDASNCWTDEAFDLIRHRVLYRIYKTRLRNKDMALFSESDEILEYNALIAETTAKMSTGKVKRSGW
jgi:hypothetical protein